MEINEKCHNCHRPNLIDRPWRSDIFCGWCGTEYKMEDEKLVLVEVHNNHLTPSLTPRLKERLRKKEIEV